MVEENSKVTNQTRYELISKIGVPHGTFPSAELAALRALTLWPDQEQDPDRTGKGWDIQIAGGEVMRVLVCGGRNFNDALTLGSWLGGIHNNNGPITALIEGGAKGADFMARKFAEWQGIPVETFEPDWNRHGRAAGPLRNKQMLDEGKPDLVVAFDGGKGTANMIALAEAAGVRVLRATKITTPH